MKRAAAEVGISIAVALWAAVVTAAAPTPPAAPSPRVVRFLGDAAVEILSGATRVDAFRVTPKREQDAEKAVGGYRIAATAPAQDHAFARELVAVLFDEKTYQFDTSKRGGFVPVVGLRAWKGDRRVDVLFSFQTDELVVFSPANDGAAVRSAQEDFDASRAALVGMVKRVFRDDPEIQALRDR